MSTRGDKGPHDGLAGSLKGCGPGTTIEVGRDSSWGHTVLSISGKTQEDENILGVLDENWHLPSLS